MLMAIVLPGSQSLDARKPAEITGFIIQQILNFPIHPPIVVQRTRLPVLGGGGGNAEQQCNNIFFFTISGRGSTGIVYTRCN